MIVSAVVPVIILFRGVLFIRINAYHTPVDFRITFLTSEDNPFDWTINYVYQIIFISLIVLLIYIFFPLVFLLMNHSCWEIEQTTLLLQKLNVKYKSDDFIATMKSILRRSYGMLDYLKDVQELLQFVFLVEFSIQSFILCMVLFTILVEPPGSFPMLIIAFYLFSQLFICCLLGNRVVVRIQKFNDAVYDVNWFEMSPTDRRNHQMILLVAQKMQGFRGIFLEVNMETFQKVFLFVS